MPPTDFRTWPRRRYAAPAPFLAAALITGLAACGDDPSPAAVEPPETRPDHLNPTPLPQSVRFVWFVPTDVEYDSATVDAIRRAAWNVRSWYRAVLGGTTFRIDQDVPVEVVFGKHSSGWYEDRANPFGWDPVWNANYWVDMEVKERLGIVDWSPRWKVAIYMSAEGGGGASQGRLVVPLHDVVGLRDGNPNVNRFWGGLAHELGHTFDLPDAAGDDGTIMSGALYAYPGASLTEDQGAAILASDRNAGFFDDVGPEFDPDRWYLVVNQATGRVAGLETADSASGVAIVAQVATGATRQQWRLEPREDGTWWIRNRATGGLMGVENGSAMPGAAIKQVVGDVDEPSNSWYVLATGYDGYEIVAPQGIVPDRSVNSLDLSSGAAGAPLVQRVYETGATQSWTLQQP